MNEQELRRLLGDDKYEEVGTRIQQLQALGRSPDEIASEVAADLQALIKGAVTLIIRIASGSSVHRCPPAP